MGKVENPMSCKTDGFPPFLVSYFNAAVSLYCIFVCDSSFLCGGLHLHVRVDLLLVL